MGEMKATLLSPQPEVKPATRVLYLTEGHPGVKRWPTRFATGLFVVWWALSSFKKIH